MGWSLPLLRVLFSLNLVSRTLRRALWAFTETTVCNCDIAFNPETILYCALFYRRKLDLVPIYFRKLNFQIFNLSPDLFWSCCSSFSQCKTSDSLAVNKKHSFVVVSTVIEVKLNGDNSEDEFKTQCKIFSFSPGNPKPGMLTLHTYPILIVTHYCFCATSSETDPFLCCPDIISSPSYSSQL